MLISQIMSRPVASCDVHETLNTAAQQMWEHDCGAVPVTDAEGRLVGVVTDRDICMASYTQGKAPHAIAVADVMARHVITCSADDSVVVAEQLMGDNQIRRVPVVDENYRPIGMLSLNDVVRLAASGKKSDGAQVAQTLAAICRPRVPAMERATPGSSLVA